MSTRLFALRPELLVAFGVFLHPLHLSAQSSVGSIQSNAALCGEPEHQVQPPGWAAPDRFESGAPREIGMPRLVHTVVRSSDGVTVPTSRSPSPPAAGWLTRAASREVARLNHSSASADSALRRVQQVGQQKRSWIGRHPVLFGTLVGFGGGFLIGYLPSPGGFPSGNDISREGDGLILGGVGAGIGALVGAAVEAATK